MRPSYEMVALWCMPKFSIKDRGIPDVQRFKWSSFKPNDHPAEKPVDLMRFCVEHGSTTGGLVFDPFMGSGTTGAAAIDLGRRFVGCELDEEHFKAAKGRIEAIRDQGKLFDPAA